jgi:endonuclease/exonuclease/phosphatase family metal-dependent hydrolase
VPPEPAPAPPTGSGGSSALRVLHWNIHHGIGTDGVFDADRIAAWVARINPDIISFNEVDDPAMAALLHGVITAYTGTAWASSYSGWGNQVLSRLPVSGTSVCSFNPAAGRVAAHLRAEINGRSINLWSAHLSADSSSERLGEIYALQACAQGWTEARIITGDFNMQQSSGEYAVAATSYTDAWAWARLMGATTNYTGNCDGCTRNSRIDYMFTSQGAWFLELTAARIYDTRDAYGYMPSDHKPLLVTYTVH